MIGGLVFALLGLPSGPTLHTVEEWRADLAHIVQQVKSRHPMPFHFGASKDEFDREVESLNGRIPALTDARIILEIFRVFGMLADSHSEPYWNTIPGDLIDMRVVPVRFYEFSDGIFVTHAQKSHEDLLGARLMRVGGRAIDQVVKEASPYMSGDNDARRRSLVAEIVLARPRILNALGLGSLDAGIEYEFETTDGKRLKESLPLLDGPSFPPPLETEASVLIQGATWSTHKWEGANGPGTLPLWMQDRGRLYWTEPLQGGKTLYLRIARVVDDPNETFDDFTKRFFEDVDRTRPERLIIDLRKNRGGVVRFGLAFVEALGKHRLGQQGRLYVLMDRGSKSGAPLFAHRIELAAKPTFAGEPSGGRPASFGNTFQIQLPNSKVSVRCAGQSFMASETLDERRTFMPSIKPAYNFADFKANRDPVIAAILAIPPPGP